MVLTSPKLEQCLRSHDVLLAESQDVEAEPLPLFNFFCEDPLLEILFEHLIVGDFHTAEHRLYQSFCVEVVDFEFVCEII